MTDKIYYMATDFRSEDEGGPSRETKALGESFGVIGDIGTSLFRLSSELSDFNARTESAEVLGFINDVVDALAGPLAAWATLIDRSKAAMDEARVKKVIRPAANLNDCLDTVAMKRGAA